MGEEFLGGGSLLIILHQTQPDEIVEAFRPQGRVLHSGRIVSEYRKVIAHRGLESVYGALIIHSNRAETLYPQLISTLDLLTIIWESLLFHPLVVNC